MIGKNYTRGKRTENSIVTNIIKDLKNAPLQPFKIYGRVGELYKKRYAEAHTLVRAQEKLLRAV